MLDTHVLKRCHLNHEVVDEGERFGRRDEHFAREVARIADGKIQKIGVGESETSHIDWCF